MVANSAFGITSLASNVMRELGPRRISDGTCLPSGVTNKECATVGTGFGFCKANETSKGVRVLPSAKYQRRDSLGSGAGAGMSPVGCRFGKLATVSGVRDGNPNRKLATARATFRMPAPYPASAVPTLSAMARNASAMSAAARSGRSAHRIAAAPETCGAAIDVPDWLAYMPRPAPDQAVLGTSTPGAASDTYCWRCEKLAS